MSPVGFEPKIPARARPQSYALDRAATGIGDYTSMRIIACTGGIISFVDITGL
jgi:hypothetical protein